MDDIHTKKVLDWIDARIYTLVGDRNLISHEDALNTVETAVPFVEHMSDHWIDDLEEVGRCLATSAKTCKKYHGRWSPRTRFCFPKELK